MARQPCIGGPADGAQAVRARGKFRWISADELGNGHGWSGPGAGRGLYRDHGDDRWTYCGCGARECGGCGVYVVSDPETGRAPQACPLCGAGL